MNPATPRDCRPGGVAVVGAHGRMGQRIIHLAPTVGLPVAARVDAGDALSDLDPARLAVVVDFSVVDQVRATARWCAEVGVPLVSGVTGLDPSDRQALAAACNRVPVVYAPNFSVGVNALFALVGELANLLGPGWDQEVVEAHHRDKVDAPSGTARRLVELLAAARGTTYERTARVGREGLVGARSDEEVGVAVVRGGDVVGEHTVLYLGEGEQVALSHRATDRDIFARGALRAACWAATKGRAPGLYDMGDVLRTP